MQKTKNLALFIDAENFDSRFIEEIMQRVNRLGSLTIKRIYGDWHGDQLKKWIPKLQLHGITPYQQFSIPSKAKNSTDFALIIDAMTFLYEKDIDIFCIVAGDSDYYTLVRTLREKNKKVIGFGCATVNKNYKNIFNSFITLKEKESNVQNKKVNKEVQSVQNQEDNINSSLQEKATKTNHKKVKKEVNQEQNIENVRKKSNRKRVANAKQNSKLAEQDRQKKENKEHINSFIDADKSLQNKIRIFVLSIADNLLKQEKGCNVQSVYTKLIKKGYLEHIENNSLHDFINYLSNLLEEDEKYTLAKKNHATFIIKR